MKGNVKIEGEEELKAKLQKMVNAVGYDKAEDILYKQAEIVRDEIKDRAPVGPTGNLKRSPIAKRMPKSRVPITIAGIDRKVAPHAHLVEFGTVKMPAHPFFRPAWDSARSQVNKNLSKEFGKAIEGSVK